MKYITSLEEVKNISGVAIIDFFANWCGPCNAIAPVFEKLSKEYPNIHFMKVNVDEAPNVAEELDVSALPTFKVLKDGVVVDELLGANEGELRKLINKYS